MLPRTGGELSAVYEVRCRAPVPAVIVKIYSERWRWKLAKEVFVYRLLESHGVASVPSILHADADTAQLVMTLLPGRPLSEVRFLGAADRHAIYRQLGGLLGAIHAIGQSAFGYLTDRILDPMPSNSAYMCRQFDKKLAEFLEFGGAGGLHDKVSHYVADRAEVFAQCGAPVLCHNDVYEGNMLVARGDEGWTLTGLIDVENAIAADPLMDLAKADYYALHGNSAEFGALVEGYGDLPDGWRARLGLYRLYHALELWDWYASIGNLAPLPGIGRDIETMVA
ncbi:aminoglycoside phosphotransferase family protein [Nocardia transvalensis]|nr:aminoglycoside phosphotransferase family protein [Nocardia transvalensis]